MSTMTVRIARWALSAGLLVWLAGPYWPWTVDDVYITVAFARQWAETGALTWTDGVRVEGYSNFLLVALLTPGLALGLDGGVLAQCIALLSSIAVLGLASARLPLNAMGTLALLGLATWTPMCRWSVVGMETTLYALLLAAGWMCALEKERRWALGLALLSLASLTRPEGAAYVLLALLLRGRRPLRRSPGDLAAVGILLGLGTYHALRVAWFGYLLPTPVLVKIGGQPWVWHGAVQGAAELLTATGLLLTAALATRPRPRMAALAAVPLLLQTAVLVRAGGDWMVHARLILPGVVASVVAIGVYSRPIEYRYIVPTIISVIALVFGAASDPVGWKKADISRRDHEGLGDPIGKYLDGIDTPFSEDLAWIVEHVPIDGKLYLSDVGMLSQVDGVHIVDLGGLVSQDVAFNKFNGDVLEWWRRDLDDSNIVSIFLRVAGQGQGWIELPAGIEDKLRVKDRVRVNDVFTQWFSSVPISEVDVEIQEARWDRMIRRHPFQPELRWNKAKLLAEVGDSEGLIEFMESSRRLWPNDIRFKSDISSVSFVRGDAPLILREKGFAMYSNGKLISSDISIYQSSAASLVINVDDPGTEGASVGVRSDSGCVDLVINNIHKRTVVRIDDLDLCDDDQHLIVSFLNDSIEGGLDRNVYIKISTGEG